MSLLFLLRFFCYEPCFLMFALLSVALFSCFLLLNGFTNEKKRKKKKKKGGKSTNRQKKVARLAYSGFLVLLVAPRDMMGQDLRCVRVVIVFVLPLHSYVLVV